MKIPKTRKRKLESLSKLKAKVWKLCSEYVRKSAADWRGYATCVTCGKKDLWKNLQAGHFIQGRHSAILFDIRGIHPQCYRCNVPLHGNLIPYYEYMLRKYGQPTIDDLKLRDKETKKFTRSELELLKTAFEEKLKLVKNK